MGKKTPDTPDVVGAAREEGRMAQDLARQQTWADRVNQSGPFSQTNYTSTPINPNTGQPWQESDNNFFQGNDRLTSGQWDQKSAQSQQQLRDQGYTWNPDSDRWGQKNDNYYAGGPVDRWDQTTTLNPEYQALLDQQTALAGQQTDYRSQVGSDWANQGAAGGAGDFSSIGGTINRGQLDQFGSPATSNVGQTIGADDWRQFGQTEQTIGADDWREFGTTNPILNENTYDERFGEQGQYRDEFGDHSMDGTDWDTIQYAPEAIRQQAQDDTYAYQQSRLDPQYEEKLNTLQITMMNQGLQPGDQQWDNRMSSFEKGKNSAYADARNTSLADSRSEAAMLWDQEMGRSEQKNRQSQMDTDNIYRARQGNIQNYQAGRQQDMQGYLDYSNSAFGQDLQSRQQQLDSNYNYGREAYQQDYQTRAQDLQSNLQYGSQAYDQDYRSQQQQWDQQFQQQQADTANYLRYGSQEHSQGLASQQQQIDAQQRAEQLNQQRYQLMNPGQTMESAKSTFT